ncbi:MAG: DNA-binding response regulator [Bacteroidetes bacterium RIFCSPLOWO2_02_FULL_36_8]|nr:MAG: DNA-binding response regulator [Bacteroidetes bacterium RIFCSPLOWO2_02_FULL_36_8]OFY69190.1 MAG: DNA-binding response regulator [Bacteroidetes bacterium RIFCSPLOWO2_12_FULL_37_12]
MKIKVAIAEDNLNLARSVRENISSFESAEVLFIAENGKELLQKITTCVPDIILMDINMPEMDGIEATKAVKHHFPDVKIIMLTIFDEEEKIFQSILAGATGYLLKDDKPSKIISALEEAMNGGAPMSPVIASKALQMIRGKRTETPGNNFNLTKRELEILELIAVGNNYQKIAGTLFISPRTVRKHIENIYTKLQVHNKVEAIQIATKNKLL